MRFIEQGDTHKPKILLIHGFGISWRMWQEHVKEFIKNYYVIVAVLDGHDEENRADFISVQDSATKVIDYISNKHNGKILTICGSSLGGTIALEVIAKDKLTINTAIIDGAPCYPMNKLLLKFAVVSRVWQMSKMRKQAKWVTKALSSVMPENLVYDSLQMANIISDTTVRNVHLSVFNYNLPDGFQTNTKIKYIYGSKEAIYCNKYAKRIIKLKPDVEIEIFKGLNHGELAMKQPEMFIKKLQEPGTQNAQH